MQHTSDTRIARIIVDQQLSLHDAERVIRHNAMISQHPQAVTRCASAHERLRRAVAEDRHIYGLTTGFGPLANRLVDRKAGTTLQQNLVHHLATGVGPWFDWASGRAIVLARMMSILQGVSGASAAAINALVKLLNSDLSPCVPCKGTVGASGDLTPLAHMVRCFQGRGAFQTQGGDVLAGADGLGRVYLQPLTLENRDGLALGNGTSAMTGLAVLNGTAAERAIQWAVRLTAAFAETQNGRIEAWHDTFAEIRPHPGQIAVTAQLKDAIGSSARVDRSILCDRRLTNQLPMIEQLPGQAAYTLRCAPQVIGAVQDTLNWHNQVVSTELCSATDNPVFPADERAPLALHGGNFMGQHVGLASDALSNGLCVLAGLAERQIARITDETLNRSLPAFLHEGTPGVNSGLMGAQVTATALLAEMRTIGAASVQSLSTNGANQDVVSLGTIAARLTQAKLTAEYEIPAIMALCVAQAIDLETSRDPSRPFSSQAIALRDYTRSVSQRLTEDRPLGAEITKLSRLMASSFPPEFEYQKPTPHE